jgi:hypothetical protein
VLGALTVFDCRTRLTSYGKQTSSHLNPSLDFSPRVWKGGALQAAEKTMWCLALALSAPPRRTARHPSSSEEGSVFNNSPPDSGGVAPRAPGWSYAEDSFSSACLAPPLQAVLIFPVPHTPHSLQPQAVRGVRQTEGRGPDFGGAKAPPFLQPPNRVLGS